MVMDSTDNIYLNNYLNSRSDGPLSMYDGSTWYGVSGPPSISSIFSINCLSILPDSSLCCNVRDGNSSFFYPMRFSAKVTKIAHPQKRNSPPLFTVTTHLRSMHIACTGLPLASILSATLTDLQGKTIKKLLLHYSGKEIIISLTDLPRGMYVLTLAYCTAKRTAYSILSGVF